MYRALDLKISAIRLFISVVLAIRTFQPNAYLGLTSCQNSFSGGADKGKTATSKVIIRLDLPGVNMNLAVELQFCSYVCVQMNLCVISKLSQV